MTQADAVEAGSAADRLGRFLRQLAAQPPEAIAADKIAVVVAHPDDETIGIGGQLPRLAGVTIVHVTDGAPRNMADAKSHGFETPEAYATARRRELEAAMALAGIPAGALVGLGIADQEAGHRLVEVSERLAGLFRAKGTEIVLTHPYEGGHPDHDATAFAVHAACALLQRGGHARPVIIEMASYHAGPAGLVPQRFLPEPDAPELVVSLDDRRRTLKARMLAAHATQAGVLSLFGIDAERFRPAPRYDFSALPNRVELYYARFDWGMTGERWQALAAEALRELGLETRPWA